MTLFLGVTAGTRVLMCTPVNVRQPGNSPMLNILDLAIWQAVQLEVDKTGPARHKLISKNIPPKYIRTDPAQEGPLVSTDG